MDSFLIYGLCDPTTGIIRYVGKSTSGTKRARSHVYPGYLGRDRSKKGNWLRGLLKKNLKPIIEILEKCQSADELIEREVWHISQHPNLLNMTIGGEGCTGRKMSQKARLKLREANLGNTHSKGKKHNLTDEQRKILADRARARSADSLVQAKISATLTGRKNGPLSQERKSKISASLMGHPGNPGSGRPRKVRV